MAHSPHPPPSQAAAAEILAWLRQVPLFANTQTESLELFAGSMQRQMFAPGELLFRQGEDSSDVYLITRGETVIRIEQEGRVVATDSVATGSCVGEMAALTGRPRSATVIAGAEGADALIVPGPRFRDLLLVQPSLGVNLLAVMSERLRQTELRKQNAALARRADELGRSKAAADAATRAKADLLASMSHELRTPLNGIIGLTELVLSSNLTPSQREYLGLVHDSGQSLLTLINDILDMSKIEAGRMEFDSQPFELRDRLIETLKTLAVRAHRKGLELACRIHPAVPDRLRGDLLRIRQVVNNLVGNAIKFTEHGEIIVEVACLEQSPQQVILQFTVRDTGLGIPKEKLAQLFQPYTQADASIARDYGGTGLGLSISAGLVQGMQGRIGAESTVGVGSAFHFTLALLVDSVQEAERPLLPARKVLIIEAHTNTAMALAEMLQDLDLQVTSVATIAEGTAKLVSDYSHVIVDARADGAMAWVEKLRTKNKAEVLVLLTADRATDAARCDELQVPHLLKPVKPSEMVRFLQSGGPMSDTPAPTENCCSERPAAARARILLAEDFIVNQKLAVSLLTRQGHQVTVAANGKEALAALEREPFDLVLMDVHMPEMDGLDATRSIRQREASSQSRLPILAMTASSSVYDIQRCLTAGMDGFVEKPVRQEQLFGTINELMATGWQQRVPAVDWPLAFEQASGQHEQLQERVTLLRQELPRLQHDLAVAASAHNFMALTIAAHTLKVALASFGAPKLADIARQLECAGKQPDSSEVDTLLASFQLESQLVQRGLQQFSGAAAD
jgi:signal transduction histidine kinase/CheY-like chemotaxis protein